MDANGGIQAIIREYDRASSIFPAFNTAHEGLAVIEEEFLELRAEVFVNHKERSHIMMRKEATHLAAMCLRFLIDVKE